MSFKPQVLSCEQHFLQSPEWELFQRALGKETFRVGRSLFVVEKLPLGLRYAYCPRGPILTSSPSVEGEVPEGRRGSWVKNILQEVAKRGCAWIRIEPNSEEELGEAQQNVQRSTFNASVSWRKAPKDVQPREILVMDISASEQELLANMKSKTRYNIRLADKKGVEVIVSNEQQYRNRFFELVRETAERAGIRAHGREHYEKLLDALGPDGANLYIAKYENEVIAINLMVFYEDLAIYLHGGSSNTHRNVMAPFLLQWRAIQDAKEHGCTWYDFGGVSSPPPTPPVKGESRVREGRGPQPKRANQNSEDEVPGSKVQAPDPWAGITRFKQGFSPTVGPVRFPGTYDIVLNPWKYRMYRLLRRVR